MGHFFFHMKRSAWINSFKPQTRQLDPLPEPFPLLLLCIWKKMCSCSILVFQEFIICMAK